MCSTIYEGLSNLHPLCMSVSKMRITILWRFSKIASPFYECFKNMHRDLWRAQKSASPLYTRLKHAHHSFTKVFKMCISFLWDFENFTSQFMQVIKKALRLCISASTKRITVLWRPLKCASPLYECFKICIVIYEGHKKCIASAWASQKCASQFYEGFQTVHLLFMSVSKINIKIYEGHLKMHGICISASTVCITVLWRP